MALLQISEPGQSPLPHQKKYAIGIDLGTTNSLVSIVRSGMAKTLTDEQGRHLLPSVVHYCKEGVRTVGHEATAKSLSDPLNTLSSVKRLLGRGSGELKTLGNEMPYEFEVDGIGMAKIKTAVGLVSPVEASAEILRSLVSRAESNIGSSIDGAVITVPAYFDEAQRQATKDCATLAGVKVLRLLNEPTAAAIAYGLENSNEGIIVVFDLGGGTFDVSILKLSRGVFEVLATGGDSALGGDDFDHSIAEWLYGQAGLDRSLSPKEQRLLLETSKAAKEELTKSDRVDIDVLDWHGTLTIEIFNEMVQTLVDKTIRACRRALRDANIAKNEINNVVLVGGSTRMPIIKEKVAQSLVA